MEGLVFVGIFIFFLLILFSGAKAREKRRIDRRDYYREYLKSDEWKRKEICRFKKR